MGLPPTQTIEETKPQYEIYSLNDLHAEYFNGGLQICDSISISIPSKIPKEKIKDMV